MKMFNDVRKRFFYNQRTGVFTWKDGRCVGKVAGCVAKSGYRIIYVAGQNVLAHRLAWLYVYGFLPKQIDHINGDPGDNRLCNLREATQSQNRQNARRARSSKSGYKGVVYCSDHKAWRAMIGPRGAVKHLGYFKTASRAHKAYATEAVKMYQNFARSV